MMRPVAPALSAEPLIKLAAEKLALGWPKEAVRAVLRQAGCTEENAYLIYKAAKQYRRDQTGTAIESRSRMVRYVGSAGSPLCRSRGHAWQGGPVTQGVASWRCVQCGTVAATVNHV